MQYQADHQADQPASELASPLSRLAAVIIDTLIIYLVPGLVLIVAAFSGDDASTGLILAGLAILIVIFVIQMALLGTRGQSIGKIAMKVRVVDAQTGNHPGWARLVLLRTIVNSIISGVIFIYWIVDSLFIFRADHRTIHDLYSGTRVVKVVD